jgi:hypothetical protein
MKMAEDAIAGLGFSQCNILSVGDKTEGVMAMP